ncbi:MAG TPA: cupredoxin domain-containing protein, partial [Roseiflexaceae bacterium]|nr:cupredoxin domain-containing protein [Roseiflexaceae bacterium]
LAQLPGLEIQPMAFGQKEIKAKVGETVAYRLDNADVAAHSFDIDELNVHTQVVAGASALTLFRPTAPGTYTFYCALPGHREAGMVGTLVVEP